MRGRRRITVIYGKGEEVPATITRHGALYYLRKASRYPDIPLGIQAIFTLSGIPAEPKRSRNRRIDRVRRRLES